MCKKIVQRNIDDTLAIKRCSLTVSINVTDGGDGVGGNTLINLLTHVHPRPKPLWLNRLHI